MKNATIFIFGSLIFQALMASCQTERAASGAIPVTVGEMTKIKTIGTDCDKPDTVRFNCLDINLRYPTTEDDREALNKSVSDWSTTFLTGLLQPYAEDRNEKVGSVDDAMQRLSEEQEVCVRENPNSPACSWSVSCIHKTLLNDGKYLTLEIEASSFMGGAHGINLSAVATFDVQTGQQLTLSDLVSDTAAFKTMAEKIFRTTRKDVFQPEDGSEPMEFGEIFPFENPQNFGLTDEGIFCHYNPYEVGPYAIGSTRFIIAYGELGGLLKIQPPASQPVSSADPIIDTYKVEGDSMVIPTFEIEVSNSVKADQLLAKQKETVIVLALFSGIPKNAKDQNEIGEIILAQKEIELTGDNRIARFEGLKFSKEAYDKLTEKDISLLINVFSGRKSSEDNLLDCALLEMKASKFGNKRFTLGCQLITENPDAQSNIGINASYSLPAAGEQPALIVTCDEQGKIEFAGQPVENVEALKASLRPLLTKMAKNGKKNFPDLKTEGCLMGNSGAILDTYEELKAELAGKSN